jgi:hypothetical protein
VLSSTQRLQSPNHAASPGRPQGWLKLAPYIGIASPDKIEPQHHQRRAERAQRRRDDEEAAHEARRPSRTMEGWAFCPLFYLTILMGKIPPWSSLVDSRFSERVTTPGFLRQAAENKSKFAYQCLLLFP